MSSDAALAVTSGGDDVPRNRRQEETFRKVLRAGMEMMRESSYADLTVRAVAARAKVAPATAYTYFSSKNHLIAEVYLDLMRQVPYFTDVNDTRLHRVQQSLRSLALVIADEPEFAAACTTAVLSNDAGGVVRVRDRIGAEIHKRIKSALGPDADPKNRVRSGDDVLRRARTRRQRHLELPRGRRPAGIRRQPYFGRESMNVQSPDIVLDPYNYDFHEDPYPYYKRLRDEAPALLQRGTEVLGVVAACGRAGWFPQQHDAVEQVRRLAGPGIARTTRLEDHVVPGDGRPPHICACGPWSRRASPPRRIRELEPRVTEIATKHLDAMLDKAAAGETVDYVDEFAGKLPMDVISELMGGVPEADRVQVRAWADGVMHREEGVTDVPPEAVEASLNLIVYYQAMVEERRKDPTDDLTSALLDAEIDGDRLTDDEVLGFMFLMVIAGNETTTKLLANAAFWGGHKNPDQLAEVYDDLSRVPLWVEETLRYDTSSQILARTVAGELTLYDTVIPPDGDVVLLLPGSAHRDERAFERPRRLPHRPRYRREAAELRQRRALLPRRPPGPHGGTSCLGRVVQTYSRL